MSPSGYPRVGVCVALACLVALQLIANRLLNLPKVENDSGGRRLRMRSGARILVVSALQVIGAIGASGLAATPLG